MTGSKKPSTMGAPSTGSDVAPVLGRGDTPFGRGFPLGHWRGVEIRAHWSVLVVLALFAWLLASSQLPAMRPGSSSTAYWFTGILVAVVFLATLTAHELAHALTARHYGMPVRRITLWMLGGLTELGGEPPAPRPDALIAAAGPLTSLAIGAVCGGLAWLVGGAGLGGAALTWLAEINLVLGVFNLLPGAPLDGGRLVRALLWWRYHDRARATEGASAAGRVLGMTLVALGFLELLAGGPLGLWLALVGWFILNGAASERYAVRAEKLRGLVVRDAITRPPAVAGDWWTVEQFLDRLTVEGASQPVFPLVDVDGRLTSVIGVSSLERTPPDRRATTRLRDVPRHPSTSVAPETSLPDLLLSMHLRGGTAVVVEDGRPIGLLSQGDLSRAVQLAGLGWPGDRTRA